MTTHTAESTVGALIELCSDETLRDITIMLASDLRMVAIDYDLLTSGTLADLSEFISDWRDSYIRPVDAADEVD